MANSKQNQLSDLVNIIQNTSFIDLFSNRSKAIMPRAPKSKISIHDIGTISAADKVKRPRGNCHLTPLRGAAARKNDGIAGRYRTDTVFFRTFFSPSSSLDRACKITRPQILATSFCLCINIWRRWMEVVGSSSISPLLQPSGARHNGGCWECELSG